MNSRTLWIIVVLVVVILGGWYLFSSNTAAPTQSGSQSAQTTQTTQTTTAPSGNVTVAYTNRDFSPASVTVTQGATVTWVNQSSGTMWVASNPHPVHTGYDGTTNQQHCAATYTGPTPLDECAAVGSGGTFSFAFGKLGTWGYHNHANTSAGGTITVVAPSTNPAP